MHRSGLLFPERPTIFFLPRRGPSAEIQHCISGWRLRDAADAIMPSSEMDGLSLLFAERRNMAFKIQYLTLWPLCTVGYQPSQPNPTASLVLPRALMWIVACALLLLSDQVIAQTPELITPIPPERLA